MTRRGAAIVVILCTVTIAWGQDKSPRVYLMAHPTKTRLKRGNQVVIAYELKNLSGSQILVGSSPQISVEMQLDLVGPDGTRVLWEGAVATAGPSFQFTLLGPRRSLTGTAAIPVNCNPTSFQGGYCLDKVGKYTGTVLYRAPSYEFLKSMGCGSAFAIGPYRAEHFDFDIE